MFRLDNKVALVTGAATGLGAGIAVTLAAHGANVIISDRPGVSLEETKEKASVHGGRVLGIEMDIKVMEQLEKGVRAAEKEFGRIDILVNNAGVHAPVFGLDVTEEHWDHLFDTNVKGGFFLAQKVAPLMIRNNYGRVIWISSQSGLVGIPGQPVYCSSKGAVIQLVKTLGLEWAKYGITVNSVAPTFIETNMTRKRLNTPEFRNYVLGKIPSGKLATIDDIAAAVIYLTGEHSGMVNCHTLSVDGGWTAW